MLILDQYLNSLIARLHLLFPKGIQIESKFKHIQNHNRPNVSQKNSLCNQL